MLYVTILATALLVTFFLPWYIVGIPAFAFSLLKATSARNALLCGFGAVFTAWLICYLYYCLPNDFILANRMAAFFFLPHSSLLLICAALIGGAVGGLAALAGFYMRLAFTKTQRVPNPTA